MEFRDHNAIYLQIVDYVSEQILLEKWRSGNKILSIRDLAVSLQVTPNTVQRAYDILQERAIISNKRGIGFFVEEAAIDRIVEHKRREFIEKELPVFFKNMNLLKIDLKELESLFGNFVKADHKK
jgi:GntR family transcriptional regulator